MCVEMSQSIAKLTNALVQFHKICPKIPKSSKNPFLNSRYADLATILDIVQEPLNNVELTVMQMPTNEHELTTILSHSSGEWVKSTYRMEPLESVIDKTTKEKAVTPQSLGSVITYQRRYALGAVLSLNIDDDNDGNSPNASQSSSEPAKPKKTAKEIMAEQAAAAVAATSSLTPSSPSPQSSGERGLGGEGKGSTSDSQSQIDSITQGGESQAAVTSVAIAAPCSVQQVAQVKSLLSQWEQSKPGIVDEFKNRLRNSGRQAIADLTIQECDALISDLRLKNLDAFFQKSLAKAA